MGPSRVKGTVWAVVLVGVMAAAACAQTPFIKVYFDPQYQHDVALCPGQVVGDLYVAAVDFNCFISAAEFAVQYPAALMWLADADVPPVTIGQTPTGISMGFGTPRNGFSPVPLCRVMVLWVCSSCVGYGGNLIRVVQHPATGFLGATNFPNNELIPAYGLASMICPETPTSDTTWGRVKALYGE